MESLASHPQRRRKKESDDDRLLKLFWKRAALKKEYSRQRGEREVFHDRLRQQEGEILRLQQQIQQLEGLLSDPVQAANAALYYQSRNIWWHCRRQLERLASDLSDHQQELEARRGMQAFTARHERALADLDEQISVLLSRVHTHGERLASLGAGRPTAWLRDYFGGPNRQIEIDALQAAISAANQQLTGLQKRRAELAAETTPGPEDLSVAAKRKINLAVIALAQELLLHFSPDGIAELAREAAERQLRDIGYGSRSHCWKMSKCASEYMQKLEARVDLRDRIRRRAAYLGREATYRLETDAVPTSGCCTLMPLTIDKNGEPSGDAVNTVNVLVEDYWDLCAVLVN